jgi:hypothetical protein
MNREGSEAVHEGTGKKKSRKTTQILGCDAVYFTRVVTMFWRHLWFLFSVHVTTKPTIITSAQANTCNGHCSHIAPNVFPESLFVSYFKASSR